MEWVADGDLAALGAELRAARDIDPSQDCSTCHR
jgi:hypothetical protein